MNMKRLTAAADTFAIESLKSFIPLAGPLIEGVKAYHASAEEEQREAFLQALVERIDRIQAEAEWYKSEKGKGFTKKIVATALNAEYADKVDILANAFANGPRLREEDALRAKFVEMIRHLSRPSIEVLSVIGKVCKKGQVPRMNLLGPHLGWEPELIDACLSELQSQGAISSTMEWSRGQKTSWSSDNAGGPTKLTAEFARFVAQPTSNGAIGQSKPKV